MHPWTANDPQVMRELVEAGVAAIITNYPNLALQAAGLKENAKAAKWFGRFLC